MKFLFKIGLKSALFGCLFLPGLVNADIALQAAISGSWIVQGDGQGALINIAETGGTSVFVVSWYAYLDGQQVWMVGSKPIPANSTRITVPVQISNGTGFGTNFISDNVNRTNWGELTFQFSSCDTGTLQYSSTLPGYGSGSLALVRLTNTQDLACQDNNNTGGTPTPSSTSLIGKNYDGVTILSEEIFQGASPLFEAIASGSTACHLRLKVKNSTSRNKSILPLYTAYKSGKQIAIAIGANLLTGGQISANHITTVEVLWTAKSPDTNPAPASGICSAASPTPTSLLNCSEIEEIRATAYVESFAGPSIKKPTKVSP